MLEKRIHEKLVRSFLDVVTMTVLNGAPMYGYKMMATIHREFGVLLSPGTLYPLLHSLEDKGLIESSNNGGKIVYRMSPKGNKKFKSTLIDFNLAIQRMTNFIQEHSKEVVLPL